MRVLEDSARRASGPRHGSCSLWGVSEGLDDFKVLVGGIDMVVSLNAAMFT
jgi:hypothetical protein